MQERGEVGEFEVGRDVAQGEGGFPTDCGAWFLRRELRNEGNDVLSGIAEGAEGEQSLLRVWTVGEYRVNDLEPLIAEEREEPDGAGLNVFVGMVEELADRGDGLGPGGLESLEADQANVLGGVGKEGDRALNGFGIGLRNARLESLGGDAVDSSRTRLVVVAMATDSGVEPIGNVERTVGTDHHIGRAKEVASLALDEVDGALNRSDALGIFVGDFQGRFAVSEFFFERHDQLYQVQRIRVQVVCEGRSRHHCCFIRTKAVNHYCFHSVKDSRHEVS